MLHRKLREFKTEKDLMCERKTIRSNLELTDWRVPGRRHFRQMDRLLVRILPVWKEGRNDYDELGSPNVPRLG